MKLSAHIAEVYEKHANAIHKASQVPERESLTDKEKFKEVGVLIDTVRDMASADIYLNDSAILCDRLLAIEDQFGSNHFVKLRVKIEKLEEKLGKVPSFTDRCISEKRAFINNLLKKAKAGIGYEKFFSILLIFLNQESPEKTKQLYQYYFSALGIQYDELPYVSKSNLRRYKRPEANPENAFDAGNNPFKYRTEEFNQLESFAESNKALFQIWAISGQSGSGKTRLAHEWLLESEIMAKWDQIIIEPKIRTHSDPEYWTKEFEICRPTVLVMDYVDSMTHIFVALRDHFRELEFAGKLPFKIRLLLIDHVFPESLEDLAKDTRLGFHGMSKNDIRQDFGAVFHDSVPLNLTKTSDQDELISYLIFHAAGTEVDESIVLNALGTLKQKQAEGKEQWYLPLFAILLGDTIKKLDPHETLPPPEVWNRRQLIENYLNNNRRLPWLLPEPETDREKHQRANKIWASACVAAATARRGIDFSLLTKCIPENTFLQPVSHPHIKDYSRAITSRLIIENTIHPLEPDMLGETYFLLFLDALQSGYSTTLSLRQPFIFMISGGDEDIQKDDAIQFIGFITRLVRNLCNDDQSEAKVKQHWETLLAFLNPQYFSNESTMQIAISIVLMEIAGMVKEHQSQTYGRLLAQVDAKVLYLSPSPEYLMRYLEHFPDTDKIDKKQFLEKCIQYDCEEKNKSGSTALMLACVNGHETIVQLLIKNDFDINAQDIEGKTALIKASEEGRLAIVDTLINNNADIYLRNIHGSTAFILAIHENKKEIIQRFLIAEININHSDNVGCTPLIIASMCKNKEIVEILLNQKPYIDAARSDNGWNALMEASYAGQYEIVKLLIQEHADVHKTSFEGVTALLLACQEGRLNVVKLLVNAKSDVNHLSPTGVTPLIIAALNQYYDIVDVLLRNNANPNCASAKGLTALMAACFAGNIKIVEKLIAAKADLNTRLETGETAIMVATIMGHILVVEQLLKAKTDIHIKNNQGSTALSCAREISDSAIEALLIEAGATV